ncbi:MAG: kinase-like domain-containing protein [Monoraphidium minutum]|nr:MAG: kinase-like domain-containing protein [Monoraphidium minutum]
MLPVDSVSSGVCHGGSNHGARVALPALRGARAALPGASSSGPVAITGRSRAVGVAGRRGGAGAARGGATCGAALAQAVATAADASSHGGDCLSRQVIDFGYDKDLAAKYELGRELGKGGNGVVRIVTPRAGGEELACKAIAKVLPADASESKRAGHVDAIKREVEVMRRLAGSLAVVRLADVFEDDDNVYIVQELCSGGELHHRIGDRHYSERTVASFLRAVLRTLAQCHSHRILHRDIKPGNFMLLDDSERAPLKAIDFGLAVPFDPEGLPRSDLGLEGTPWFMAPEVLSSQVVPASDVWAAGVMAHQLLTGRLPFDDHRNPSAPSISVIWRSVLCDKVCYNAPWWGGISEEAKEFVASLLDKDPAKRPTAKEALNHPWLRGDSSERSAGKQIDLSVVARIQRFAQGSRFKRGVFQMIAEELLARPGAAAALAASASAQDLSMRGKAAAAATASQDGEASGGGSSRGGRRGPVGADPSALRELLRRLDFDPHGGAAAVDRAAAAEALARMGFRLQPSELAHLVGLMDTSNSGKVRKAAFAASQIDFRHLQTAEVDIWIEMARRVFARLDQDQDGVISPDEIVASLRAKLPADELRATLEHVRAEAGGGAVDAGLDFESFLNMLKVGSVDSLDQYDMRLDLTSPGSIGRLQALLDASQHGSDGGSSHNRGSSGRGGLFRVPASAPVAPAAAPAPAGGGFRFDVGPPAKPAPAPAAAPAAGAGFRFDFGWQAPPSAAEPKKLVPAAEEPATSAPWPGLTMGAPAPRGAAPGAPAAAPFGAGPAAGSGARGVRGAGELRTHGGSLYKNLAVKGPAPLSSVRE